MRCFMGFIFVLALGVMGCGEDQCAAACAYYGDDEGHIFVQMGPSVTSTYDVDLELDGGAGAFTCERVEGGWVATSQTGSGKALDDCAGYGFTIFETPDTLEISVNAQDGSWIGSVQASPVYERPTVCGTLCAPGASVTITKQ
jgi:hypothetical protein